MSQKSLSQRRLCLRMLHTMCLSFFDTVFASAADFTATGSGRERKGSREEPWNVESQPHYCVAVRVRSGVIVHCIGC